MLTHIAILSKNRQFLDISTYTQLYSCTVRPFFTESFIFQFSLMWINIWTGNSNPRRNSSKVLIGKNSPLHFWKFCCKVLMSYRIKLTVSFFFSPSFFFSVCNKESSYDTFWWFLQLSSILPFFFTFLNKLVKKSDLKAKWKEELCMKFFMKFVRSAWN